MSGVGLPRIMNSSSGGGASLPIAASDVSVTPFTNFSATNAQAGFQEVQADIDTRQLVNWDPTIATVVWYEDFLTSLNNSTSLGVYSFTNSAAGTGAACVTQTVVAADNTNGVWGMTAGNASPNTAGYVTSLVAILFGQGTFEFAGRFRLNTLATGTDDYVWKLGFGNSLTTSTNGAFLYYDRSSSAFFKTNTVKAGATTSNTTAITVDTNWHTFRMVIVNSTTVDFYIDGVFQFQHTTNIPTATHVMGIMQMMQKTAGTLNLRHDADWVYTRYTPTSPRGVW